MPSSWTTNLQVEKPATGEQAGVWGDTANRSYDILDTAIDGNVSIPLSTSGYTLLTNQGSLSTGHNKVIVFTGTIPGPCTITISPNTLEKIYYIINHTTGGFPLNITQGTGPSYSLPNGYGAVVYTDGLGPTASVKGALADLQVNSLLVATNLTVQGSIVSPAVFTQPVTFQAGAPVTIQGGATISPSLILTLGGDQPYDMYYRNSAGQVARLANGAAGQVLQASSSGPVWTTPAALGIGSSVSGSAPRLIFFADASSTLAQDNNLAWLPGTGLNGHLGINQFSPQYPLEVLGDINVKSGVYRVNGAPLVLAALTAKSVVTGSRSLGTVYSNQTGKPMYVAVTCVISALSYIQLLSDTANPPTTINAAATNANSSLTAVQSVSGWVMPGHFYQIALGSATLSVWIEAT